MSFDIPFSNPSSENPAGYYVGMSAGAPEGYTPPPGFPSRTRTRGTPGPRASRALAAEEKELRQAEREAYKMQALMDKQLEEYTPVYGLQFDANPRMLHAIGNRINEFAQEWLGDMQAIVAQKARENLDQVTREAMARVKTDQKRRGYAERARYKDRHGQHHLADAIWASREIVPMGDGFEFVGFNEDILNRMTKPWHSKHGYWYEYETGSHGTYQMPRGIWIGPETMDSITSEGRGRVHTRAVSAGRRGMDRFYPQSRGGRVNKATGKGGMFAHQAPNPILREAVEELANKIGHELLEENKTFLAEIGKQGYRGIDVEGHGSVTRDQRNLGEGPQQRFTR